MPELARCRCDRFTSLQPAADMTWATCTAVATQEDLLCDECREGCNFAIAGQPHLTVKDMVLNFKPVNVHRPAPRYEQGAGRLERSHDETP